MAEYDDHSHHGHLPEQYAAHTDQHAGNLRVAPRMQRDVRERWHSAGDADRSRLHRHRLRCGSIRWTAGADEAVSEVNVHTMAKLIYSGITSLDGYVADQAGRFDWSVPDTEVHTAINDLTRSVGTFLWAVGCTRCWSRGKAWTSRMSRPSSRISPRSGGQPTRSCTPPRWRPRPASGRGSKGSSTLMRSGG